MSWRSTGTQRNHGIDAFRLLTAMLIIATHGGRFEHFHPVIHDVVALLSKWSVPFFFLVLGYFLGKKTDRNRAMPSMLRIAAMFTVASIILLPLDFYTIGVHATLLDVAKNFLISGTHFHLWYLSSLLVGLVMLRLADEYRIRGLLPACAMTALGAAVLFGTYWAPQTMYFGRHLMALPFLWFGTLLSKRIPSMRQSLAWLFLGLGVECLETPVIHGQLHKDLADCPLLIGTIPFAVGMFGVAANLKTTPLLMYVGRLGRRFTGCMYVTHVYSIALVAAIAAALGIQDSPLYCAMVVPLVFACTLAALRVVDYFAPHAIDVLLGDKQAIQSLGARQAVVSDPLVRSTSRRTSFRPGLPSSRPDTGS